MSLSRVFLIVLLLTAAYIFRGASTDTCQCDTTYSNDSASCGLPPPPAIDFCDEEYEEDEFNSLFANITKFCRNECLDPYLSCISNSSNNCMDRQRDYFEDLCETYEGDYCWALFANVTNDMILNCTRNQDPCEVAESDGKEGCEEFECRSNLIDTRNFLSCCALSLFDEVVFLDRPSTNRTIYGTCDVVLFTTECGAPTSPPTTESAAKDTRSFIAVIATVVFIATYICI